MLRAIFVGLPVLIFAVGVPLALRWVPPNRFYGFRTSTTFSSLGAWYQINFATGLALMAAGAVAGLLVILLDHGMIALTPEPRYIVGILLTGLLAIALLIPVVIYSDKF